MMAEGQLAGIGGNRLWFGIAGVLGIGALAIALWLAAGVRSFVLTAQRAPGTVVALNAGGSHPQISFTTRTGQTIAYPQGGLIFGYRQDDAVEVLYDPANPQGSATISAIGAVWSAPLIAGLVGAVFVGTALFGLLSTSND